MEPGNELRNRKRSVTVILSNIFFLGMGVDSAVIIFFSIHAPNEMWRLLLLAIGLPQITFIIAICFIVLAKINILDSDDEKSTIN